MEFTNAGGLPVAIQCGHNWHPLSFRFSIDRLEPSARPELPASLGTRGSLHQDNVSRKIEATFE